MSHDREYELYLEGAELARREEWLNALPLLEESWRLEPHPKTGLWLNRCYESQGDLHMALLYIAAAYAINLNMDDVATRFAEILIGTGDTERAQQVLDAVLRRNTTYGPALALKSTLEVKP